MKSQIPNNKSQINNKFQKRLKENRGDACLIYGNPKRFGVWDLEFLNYMVETPIYNLEERSYQFAKKAALFCRKLSKSITNTEYSRQLIRASGSIGANYIEANESLGKKDFVMRSKICRKEAKEAAYWLRLIAETNPDCFMEEDILLRNEAIELKKIFSSIITKCN